MKYVHIGWCKEGTADKVWGIIQLTDTAYWNKAKYATFWGRRGSKLQTKLWEGSAWDAKEMFLKKQNKGYRAIEIDELNTVYPEFQQDLEKTAFWAALQA